MQSTTEGVTVTRMAGYAKLFSRILDSTVWREDNETRLLWITLLAMADRNGNVMCTIPGLADRARISLKQCEDALTKFQQPDKYSWSQEDEGRKIRVIDGGWFLINHAKYRAMLSKDETREKTRLRVAEFRKKKSVTPVTSNASNDIATTDTATAKSKSIARINPGVEEIYELYPRKVGRKKALESITAAVARLCGGEIKGEAISRETAIAGLKERVIAFAESPAGKRGTYTPHPTTWFNRSSYLDDRAEWSAVGIPAEFVSQNELRVAKNRAAIASQLNLSQRPR